ncbi:sacsin N-terminal ATP-binding-like domain-containing protein [Streptosporangium sp. OZ121]|uniref:sacsin N-terminal ATP-binding-like domain-containing protein n=1 Tax=Streptosporangium sp. OZ121 TaxID=3444183 RepID=UPI003F794F16
MINVEIGALAQEAADASSGETYAGQLREYALAVLGESQNTKVWKAGQQLRALSHSAAREYAGRFLLELLQNAHDAHPGNRTDGRVHILLNEHEGPHGMLYVANGGTPFTWEQVEAICKLALSDKTIGEGIGNKGVGFRSVLEITDAPEIFSSQVGGSNRTPLNGYRFRFAVEDDLRALLKNEELVRQAVEELPPFQIPYPILDLPAVCAELAADGHVTVVRLPLRSDIARLSVARRLKDLATSKAPVMLFLDRLERLVLERRAADGEVHRTELTRQEQLWADSTAGHSALAETEEPVPVVSLAEVDLGPLGEFLLARGHIPAKRLQDTANAAVDEGLLDESWRDWTEPAAVEIALLYGAENPPAGHMYTFLPLGDDVAAPLHAHLNAPFFTKFDRTGLNREHQLNVMLFEALAETCLIAAATLRAVPTMKARRAAVDLISWDPGALSAGLLSDAARRVHSLAFSNVPVVPTNGDTQDDTWCVPTDAVRWPAKNQAKDLAVLTAQAARSVGVAVADPHIGDSRLERLARTCSSLQCSLDPSTQKLADYVEQIVGALPLPATGEAADVWNGLYIDLFVLFDKRGEALRGRQLLLADDGTIRCFNGSLGAAVSGGTQREQRQEAFFQPTQVGADDTGELRVPEMLSKQLFYAHPALQWTGGEDHLRRQQAREFLEKSRLIRAFDAAGLLEHVRNALQEGASEKLRLQALRFVFQLYRSRRSSKSLPIGELGLYVPSAAGPLVPAQHAAFGSGWNTVCGADLVYVVTEGCEISPDLKWMNDHIVAPPQRFIEHGDTQSDWLGFLEHLGVTDGLIPRSAPDARTWITGSWLTVAAVVNEAKTPPVVTEQWRLCLPDHFSYVSHPRTGYHGSPAFRLPGQEVVCGFTEKGRLAYAQLILHGLTRWPDDHFTSVWTSSHSREHDAHRLPTPLAAFIREQPWLPVRTRTRTVGFARPADAWCWPPALADEEPSFGPTVAHAFRSLLDQPAVKKRLRDMGLSTWGSPQDSAKLIATLGALIDSGAVYDEDRPVLQRANQKAWTALISYARGLTSPRDALQPLMSASLLAETGDQLSTIKIADLSGGTQKLYITGERDSLASRLIRETENALLVVPDGAWDATRLLARVCTTAVRHVDDATMTVMVDGQPLASLAAGSQLLEHLPWLPYAIGVLEDHSPGVRTTEAGLTGLVSLARRIRIRGYETLDITVDDEPIELPARQNGVLPLPDDDQPLILAPMLVGDDLTWESVAQLVEAIGHVVGRPRFAAPLKLAAYELRDRRAVLASPTDQQLADVLSVSLDQLQETVRRLDGSIAGVLKRCYPLLLHCLGLKLANELTVPPPPDLSTFQALLTPYDDELPETAEELVTAARRARNVEELRIAMNLDFAEFNRTLAVLTPQYHPISRADAHEEELRKHIDLNRTRLVDRLRWAVLDRFETREPIADWAQTRSLQWITAPEEWAFTHDSVDTGLLREHIEASLTARLGAPTPQDGKRLPALDQLRGDNNLLIRHLVPELTVLIKAVRRPLPGALAGAGAVENVATLLDQVGVLDFRLLTKDDIVAWLDVLGQWPAGMPTTTVLAAHGLTQADLDPARRAELQAREERARRRRVINLGRQEFDVDSGDFTDVITGLQQGLEENPEMIAGRGRFATLEALPGRRAVSGPGGRTSVGLRADRELSPAQRTAIGFAGEWIAYQWLRKNYPATDESSWVSTSRQNVFPGSSGDDGLGFDFRVGSGQEPLMFEVKATQGDGGQFELGESEVRAAQSAARNDRWRLLVITWVLDPERTTVTMLRNPFSAQSQGLYREEGGALRFSYRL